MSTPVTIALAAVVRAATVAAGYLVWDRAWTWFFYDRTGQEPIGADIGEGLVFFAVVVLVSAAWGGWDGWRRPYGAAALAWVGAGALVALAAVLRSTLVEGTEAGLSDLVTLAPFLFSLVAVPALVTGALVAAARPRRRSA